MNQTPNAGTVPTAPLLTTPLPANLRERLEFVSSVLGDEGDLDALETDVCNTVLGVGEVWN
jgi:hypothetical protein